MLALVATAELLALTLWFSATAVAPALQAEWQLSLGQVGALTMAVQLGFVVGALVSAIFNLPDLVPARYLFAISAVLGAAANASIAFADADQFTSTVLLRFATGAALAGVYPSGLKVMAGWFSRGRGMALGVLVGALTVGSATPHFVRGLGLDWQSVLWASSALSVLAALLMLRVGDGPFETAPSRFSWGHLLRVIANRRFRQVTAGYLGHMWELYAMWAWIAAWLAASAAAGGWDASSVPRLTFYIIASGGLGCWVVGAWADEVGRAYAAAAALIVSGTCALATPLLFHAPVWLSLPILSLWGFSVVADSAQFSAMVTEVVDDRVRGTALTLQTALGFLLTLASIRLTGFLSEVWGWQWAFPMLALGPVVGVAAMARLRTSALTTGRGS